MAASSRPWAPRRSCPCGWTRTGRPSGASWSSSTRAAPRRTASPATCWRRRGGWASCARAARWSRPPAARTSIALALACAQMGLRFTAVMPEGVTERARAHHPRLRRRGGADRRATRASRGAIARPRSWPRERGAFAPRQFENPDNAEAHRVWTGQEILAQVPGGLVHGVVSGVGTGGTIVGLYQAFAEAGCPVTPFVARPIAGATGCDLECCSFSSRVPGVVDGLSKLYRDADLPGLRGAGRLGRAGDVHRARAHPPRLPGGPLLGTQLRGGGRGREAARARSAQVVTVFPDRMERYFSTELIPARGSARDALPLPLGEGRGEGRPHPSHTRIFNRVSCIVSPTAPTRSRSAERMRRRIAGPSTSISLEAYCSPPKRRMVSACLARIARVLLEDVEPEGPAPAARAAPPTWAAGSGTWPPRRRRCRQSERASSRR